MDVGDLGEDVQGLPHSVLHSPFSLTPSSESSRTLSAQAPFHSAPDHQSTDQTQPAVYQHHHPKNLHYSNNPHPLDTEPPCKRPRLEDSNAFFALAKNNKPIGIAFPQKIETKDEYGNQVSKGDSSNLSNLKSYLEEDVGNEKEKLRTGSTSSSSGSSEDSCVQVTKPYVDSGFAENSCTEIGSSVDGHVGTLSCSEGNSDIEDDDDDDNDGRRVELRPIMGHSGMAARGVDVAKNSSSQGSSSGGRAVVELPRGKTCHIFISHSTTDREWAERTMFVQLSRTWVVQACYQCMPDSSRYDDAQIINGMQYSCIVIIGLSPAYLHSGRCVKEWNNAVNLAKTQGICVIVASVTMCSRPAPLKSFLYLDFCNKEKLKRVWEVLQKSIREEVKCFQERTPISVTPPKNTGHSHSHHPHQQPSHSQTPQQHHHHHSEYQHHNHSHQQQQEEQHFHHQHLEETPYQNQSPDLSSQGKVSFMDSDEDDEHSRQVMAEFDQMYHESQEEMMGNQLNTEPKDNGSSDGWIFPDDDGAGAIMEHYGDDQMAGDFGLSTPGFDADAELTKLLHGGQGGVGEEEEEVRKGEVREEEEEEEIDGRKWECDSREEVEPVKTGEYGEEKDDVAQKCKLRRRSSSECEEGEVIDDESLEDVRSRSSKNGEEREESGSPELEQEESSRDITKFYDNLAKPDVDKRDESPIKLMRNFNNWVKSILLRTYLHKCVPGSTALDLCCGKGGDLLKWKEGKIKHLVCADISGDSIEAAKERHASTKMKGTARDPPFTAEFYTADCTKERLIDLATQRWHFNISSCQFSLHYSFESYEKAYAMLQNACESLRPGAYFVGTTVDADQLVYRLIKKGKDENGVWSIGNNVYSVTLDSSLDITELPLFGARYNFKLHDVVDLPEYLIHFPLLVKMLEEFDMELVNKQNFYHFYQEHRDFQDDLSLLYRMSAFDRAKGTMSQDEWDVIGLYLVFVFQKRKPMSHSENV